MLSYRVGQIPITKSQAPTKFQSPNDPTRSFVKLDIGYYLAMGAWSLMTLVSSGQTVFSSKIDFLHGFIAFYRFRSPIGNDSALLHDHDPVGDAHHDIHVMLDEKDGPFFGEIVDEAGNSAPLMTAHPGRGFVEE
jgi:hypothetical protein